MKIKVDAYSGFKANERPWAFLLDHHRYHVKEVLDQWYSPDSVYFKIRASDGNLYILKYYPVSDEWSLESYRRESPGPATSSSEDSSSEPG